MALEVVCATAYESSHHDDCRCITTNGYQALNSIVTETPAEMCDKIEDEGREFYVEHRGSRTELEAVKDGSGTKYVRTEANDTEDANLLQLGSC